MMELLYLQNSLNKMIVLLVEDVEENSIQQQLINIFRNAFSVIKGKNDNYKKLSH